MKTNTLSVIIPAYNEETNIRLGAVDKVIRYLEKQSYEWELIIVNDGSTDKSVKLLSEISKANKNIRLLDNPHQGKAATVISGLLSATKDIVLFTDLDQATPINQSEKILPWFDRGFDIVIGSRNQNREGAPILRIIMARGFMFLRSFILGLQNIHDTQCGFKAFKRSIIAKLFTKLLLYKRGKTISGAMVTAGFDIEMLYLATKLGLKIKEVPVEWHYVETRRVNPLKDSIQGLSDIIRIKLNAFLGKYN
jgi:glycosyltransferase involved in cell wall biosynthesis